jgi:hypothetical protein
MNEQAEHIERRFEVPIVIGALTFRNSLTGSSGKACRRARSAT